MKSDRDDLKGRSSRTILRRQTGFTLIELILTIVIVGIISGIGASLLRQGVGAVISEDARANLTSDGRLASERMVREIRMARSRTVADLPACCSATTLTFLDITGTQIVYTSAGGNITRQDPSGTNILASNVTSLTFSYFQQNGITAAVNATQVWTIQVDLTFTRSGESQSFRVRAHPRTFI